MRNIKPGHAHTPYLILEAILLAGLFVRIWGLSGYAYNGDEMQFILIAKGATLAEVWRRGLSELHPPLLHFIRHYVLMLTPDIFVQRLFSVMAGMISILGMYRLGVLLRGQALGVFCALCMAFAMLAVSTSMTIRDYAFFTMFLLGAFYCFVRYQRDHKWTDLLGFTSLIFLSCATNFSGFLVAAACGLYEGYRLLRAQRWRVLFLFCISFLPLSLLGFFFYVHYMAPGTAGPMWNRLAIVSGFSPADFAGRLSDTCLKMYYFFVPLGGIRNIPGEGILMQLIVPLMLVGSFCLIVLQVMGLRRMYRQARELCCFILVLWGVTVIAALLNIYPFAPSRHSCYLLPFFILPLGYLLEPLTHRVLLSPARARCGALCIVLAALVMGESGVYIGFADELSLKQKDLALGQEYLAANLQPGDAIVTGGSAAYFYLLDAKDNGKTAYNRYGSFPYFNGTTVLAGFDAPFKPHASWQPVRDELESEVNAHIVSPKGKFWFVMYGWKNIEIWRLMECSAIQHRINDFFSREGVVIFSIRETAFAEFLKDNAAWERCYSDYKPLVIGTPFHAVPKP